MFWMKQEIAADKGMDLPEKVATEAEGLYRSGKLHCAEAVLAAVKNNFKPELPDDVVKLATGFGNGSGSGCICGAITGATMSMGLVLQDDRRKVMRMTRELHKWFQQEYGSACCRVIRGKHHGVCPELTGKVAGKTAELLGQK